MQDLRLKLQQPLLHYQWSAVTMKYWSIMFANVINTVWKRIVHVLDAQHLLISSMISSINAHLARLIASIAKATLHAPNARLALVSLAKTAHRYAETVKNTFYHVMTETLSMVMDALRLARLKLAMSAMAEIITIVMFAKSSNQTPKFR